ncbi:MAG: efflux RND transporter periplasmic adaptor subunit [Acidobacteria bacterium]|nr:efflux RND transporter periplasmic adaptor subunit [Acidobacteriota bacterium]
MKTKIIWITVIVVAAVGLYLAINGRRKPEEKYRTAAIDQGDITQTVAATGALSAVTTVQVGSQVSGIIAKLYADFNSQVKKGDLLAELDETPFKEKIAQNVAALEKARVEMRNAEISLRRQKALSQQGLAPQADIDQAQANYDAARASVAQAQATLNQAQTDLRNSRIKAPIDGVVVSRQYDVGQTVAASFQAPTLFTIAQDLTKMQVSADISESDIGQIKVGEPVRFNVDAYPDRNFRGKVSQVRLNATVNQNVVTYPVIVEVNNEDLLLKPTMTANVTVDVASAKNVLRVPNAALRFRPEVKEGSEKPAAAADRSGGSPAGQTGSAAAGLPPAGGEGTAASAGAAGGQAGAGTTTGQGRAGSGRGSGGRGGAEGSVAAAGGSGAWAGQGRGGRAGARARSSTVYMPAGPNGEPRAAEIRTGITDGRFTQIVSGDVKAADLVIVGLATTKASATGNSPLAAPRAPGGPGGGRRGF